MNINDERKLDDKNVEKKTINGKRSTMRKIAVRTKNTPLQTCQDEGKVKPWKGG